MQINETQEKELSIIEGTVSGARNRIRLARQDLETLNMENGSSEVQEEEEGEAVRYLSNQQLREWRRLSRSERQRFMKEGIEEAEKEALKERGEDGEGSIWIEGGKDGITKPVYPRKENQEKRWHVDLWNPYESIQGGRFSSHVSKQTRLPVAGDTMAETAAVFSPRSETRVTAAAVTTGVETAAAFTTGTETSAAFASGAASGGAGFVRRTGKKTAEKFKEYLESHAAAGEQAIQQVRNNLEDTKAQNQQIHSLPAFVRYTSAAATIVVLNAASILVQMATTFLIALLSVLIVALIPLLIVIVFIAVLLAIAQQEAAAGYGLPKFITSDMMEAFFEVQEETGIPVSSGIAQVITESGFGLYGPYGGSGEGLSQLAYDHKNLFGIKYFPGDQYAAGSVDMTTGEQTEAGEDYTVLAGFSVYPDYASCIRQRAWMLSREPYASRVGEYLNPCDGTYTKDQAVGFVNGIRQAGWATDISYVETCVKHMNRYNLYRFDNMTFEEYQSGAGGGEYDGNVTPTMQRIAEGAEKNLSLYPCTPDMCAAWVTGVYQAAGAQTIPWGNAIDMWNTYKGTGSVSMENIPPGAIVCGSGSGYMGSLYGHVGIYIGNGMVANNVGHHSIETLEDWCSWQTADCQGHVGWIGWVYPGGIPTE